MIERRMVVAGALLGALALTVISGPALAGTCVPVTVKGHAPDPATATTKASAKLTQRAASLRGKVKNSSTNCQKMPGGFVCTTSAVVCP
jgi:hypothetical protein